MPNFARHFLRQQKLQPDNEYVTKGLVLTTLVATLDDDVAKS